MTYLHTCAHRVAYTDINTRALLSFLVNLLCDTDLCALNLPKGMDLAWRFLRSAAERAICSLVARDRRRQTQGAHVIFGWAAIAVVYSPNSTYVNSSFQYPRPPPPGKRLFFVLRVSGSTLPSGRHLRCALSSAELSWTARVKSPQW